MCAQFLLQRLLGTVQFGLHSGYGGLHDISDLFVGQFLVSTEHEDSLLGGRKSIHRATDQSISLRLLQR